jgi:hypothetical protein
MFIQERNVQQNVKAVFLFSFSPNLKQNSSRVNLRLIRLPLPFQFSASTMGLISTEGIVTATAYSTLAAITIVSEKHSPLDVVSKNSHTRIRGLLTPYGDAFTTFGSVL